MKFAKSDIRPDTPRPLARCGAHVAEGRDARWRGVKVKRIDGVAAHKLRRGTR